MWAWQFCMGVAVLCCVAVFGGFRWQFWSVFWQFWAVLDRFGGFSQFCAFCGR